jgi:DNA processing protein
MKHSELFYQLALTLVPHVGDARAKALVNYFGSAEAIFKARLMDLERVESMGTLAAASIKEFNDFSLVEQEMAFIEKYKIQTLFLNDKKYPQRLLQCFDSPAMLFYKGTADLNASKMVAIVGTRKCTDYGTSFTDKLVNILENENAVIVSGLAYGIDAAAHKAALKYKLPTVGVVAHGLNKMYPAAHADLAKEMLKQGGGILSEFFTSTKADIHHFPLRNRIVAGMCDATIVIESEIQGGSMITAKLADSYNRDVFALPGRTTDKKSSGCNYLVKHNKAIMLTDPEDLLEAMGWKRATQTKLAPQRELFIELSPEERSVLQILQEKETVHIDELNLRSGLSSSITAATILNLELKHVIASLPGKLYKLQ